MYTIITLAVLIIKSRVSLLYQARNAETSAKAMVVQRAGIWTAPAMPDAAVVEVAVALVVDEAVDVGVDVDTGIELATLGDVVGEDPLVPFEAPPSLLIKNLAPIFCTGRLPA